MKEAEEDAKADLIKERDRILIEIKKHAQDTKIIADEAAKNKAILDEIMANRQPIQSPLTDEDQEQAKQSADPWDWYRLAEDALEEWWDGDKMELAKYKEAEKYFNEAIALSAEVPFPEAEIGLGALKVEMFAMTWDKELAIEAVARAKNFYKHYTKCKKYGKHEVTVLGEFFYRFVCIFYMLSIDGFLSEETVIYFKKTVPIIRKTTKTLDEMRASLTNDMINDILAD